MLPISVVLVEGVLRVRSWDAANAVAVLPPIICGAAAWQGARWTGHSSKRAWWWDAVATVSYYVWWVVIVGVVVGYSLS